MQYGDALTPSIVEQPYGMLYFIANDTAKSSCCLPFLYLCLSFPLLFSMYKKIHQGNVSVKCIPHFYIEKKTGVCRGRPIFLIIDPGTR